MRPAPPFHVPSFPMSDFEVSRQADIEILSVKGRIEPDDWKALKDALAERIAGNPGGTLVVDLSELTYIASSGFRELFLAGRNLAREGGSLAVSGLQGEVKRVFQLAGFATAYPIFETREEAIRHFESLKS